MKWFRPVSVDPRLAEGVQRLEVLCAQLAQKQSGLELALKQLSDDVAREMRGIVKEAQNDYGRLNASIESVRNSLAGVRGGRPSKADAELDRAALQLGRQVLEQCATAEGALAFAADIEAKARAAAPNGKPSPI